MQWHFSVSKKKAGPVPVKVAALEKYVPSEPWRDSALQRGDCSTQASTCLYQELNYSKKEIRLLKVLAGRDSEPLRCTLHCIPLSEASANYETVSYCWGQSISKTTAQINGKPVSIGSSAAAVLYRMRSTTTDRLLWIDAICINQNSANEKSQQVALMGLIYSKGQRNLVWLGDDHGSGDECVDIIQTVLAGVRRRTRDFQDLWRTFFSGPFASLEAAMDSSARVAPLSRLFESRWFSRLWVAQEAALASNSICHYGPVSIKLVDVLRCAAWLDHAQRFLPKSMSKSPGLSNAARLWRLVDREYIPEQQFQAATQDLYTIYNRTRRLECSVPRDKIYALIGMFDCHDYKDSLLLRPVYKGKGDMEVFRDATRVMLKGVKHLELLRVDHFPAPHSDWPSWVVDFARRRDFLPLRAPNGFCPDDDVTFRMEDSQCPNELILRGIRVDVVVESTASVDKKLVPDQTSSDRVSTILRSIDRLLEDVPKARHDIYKTLIAGRNWQNSEAGQGDLEDYKSLLMHLQRYPKVPRAASWPSMTQYGKEAEKAIRYFDTFSSTAYARRFFTTKHGLFGIGPGNLEIGDVVAVLYGSQLPYVLRPLGSKKYRLVGECYANGIMHGEAVRHHRDHHYGPNTFVIV